MREHTPMDSSQQQNAEHVAQEGRAQPEWPCRMMTALEVAAFVGCHEESVRRAYLCGQLKRQRFGVRSWRFHPGDVQDWIARGAPTRIS